MTCPDCQLASERMHHGYRSGCKGCAARAVARGPDFFRCRTAGKQDQKYRQLLAAVGVTHEEAMAAAKLDADVAIRVEAQEKETACRRAKLMLRCGA